MKTLNKTTLIKNKKTIILLMYAFATGYRYQIRGKKHYNHNSSIKDKTSKDVGAIPVYNRLLGRGFKETEEEIKC